MSRSKTRWLLAVPLVVVAVPLLVMPLLSILRASLDTQQFGVATTGTWSLDNYVKFATEGFFWKALLQTVLVGLLTTVVCVAVGFPYAYMIARRVAWRQLQIAALVAPLLVNMVVRVYGWQTLLSDNGVINSMLIRIGVIEQPLPLLYNMFGVIVALVHVLLPYMVLSIYAVLQTIDPALENAARTLGAGPRRALWTITVPLARPGVTAGSILVFTLSAGSFLVPAVMGGGRVSTLPALVFQYAQVLNWPFASALAIVLMLVTVPPILAYQRASLRTRKAGR